MRRRVEQILLAAFLVSLPETSGAFLPAPYGGKAVFSLPDAPVSLDPARATRASENQVLSLLFDTLYHLSRPEGPHGGKPVAHLVEEPAEVLQNGREWRLRLRHGIQLSSGRPLQAADVVASLKRLSGGPNAYLLGPIRSLEAEGASVIVLRLTRPTPELPSLLSAVATAVAVKEGGSLVGTGPFVLVHHGTDQVTLRANATHFAGRPFLDEIQLKVFSRASAEVSSFQVGGVQLSLHGKSVFGGKPRYPTQELESSIITPIFIGVGRTRSYLREEAFRLALLRGVDRRRLKRVASVGQAEVAEGPVSTYLLRAGLKRIAFDRHFAKKLLDQVAARQPQMKKDMVGGRLKLSLLVDASRFADEVIAGQIVADLDRLGIAAAIEKRPPLEYQSRLESGRYDLVLGRLALQVPHPAIALASALAVGGEGEDARRCLATGRCGARESARFMRRLSFIPLVHVATSIFFDARLGSLSFLASGLLPFADVYWQRRLP